LADYLRSPLELKQALQQAQGERDLKMIDSVGATEKQSFLKEFEIYSVYLANKRFTQTNPLHKHAVLYAVAALDFSKGLIDLEKSPSVLSPWLLLRGLIETSFSLVYLSLDPKPSEPTRLFELKLKDLLESKKHITLLNKVNPNARGADESLKSIQVQISCVPERAKTKKDGRGKLKAISFYEILERTLSVDNQQTEGWYGIYSLCCGASHAQITYLHTHLIDSITHKIEPFQRKGDADFMVYGNAKILLSNCMRSLDKILCESE
jgi:hypothetical protein